MLSLLVRLLLRYDVMGKWLIQTPKLLIIPFQWYAACKLACTILPGLEQQLLGIVVRKERPELEEQKDALVTNIAAGKLKLIELEDAVLRSVEKQHFYYQQQGHSQ